MIVNAFKLNNVFLFNINSNYPSVPTARGVWDDGQASESSLEVRQSSHRKPRPLSYVAQPKPTGYDPSPRFERVKKRGARDNRESQGLSVAKEGAREGAQVTQISSLYRSSTMDLSMHRPRSSERKS